MPPYPEKQSPLLVRLKQKKTVTEAEPTTEQQQQPSNSTDEPTTSKLAVNVPAQDTQNGLLVSLDTNESNGYYDTTVPAQTTTTTTTTQMSSCQYHSQFFTALPCHLRKNLFVISRTMMSPMEAVIR